MGEKSSSKGWCGWFLVLVILALVVGAIVIAIKKKQSDHSDKAAPVPGPPGAISQKYADALKIAIQFFDVQKCTYILLSKSLTFSLSNNNT